MKSMLHFYEEDAEHAQVKCDNVFICSSKRSSSPSSAKMAYLSVFVVYISLMLCIVL